MIGLGCGVRRSPFRDVAHGVIVLSHLRTGVHSMRVAAAVEHVAKDAVANEGGVCGAEVPAAEFFLVLCPTDEVRGQSDVDDGTNALLVGCGRRYGEDG